MATVPFAPPTHSAPASTLAAKPLAQQPSFPLSPLELARWNRFAKKGGIGAARARVDKVSADGGVRDLMLLEGDEVVVLMELGGESYLGYCEGVVGLFHGREVQMLQPKLKRPVISSRPPSSQSTHTASSASSKPAPPSAPAAPAPSAPRALPALDVRAPSPSRSAPKPLTAAPPKRLSRSSSFDSSPLASLSSRPPTSAAREANAAKKPLPAPKRKPVPEVEILSERFDESHSQGPARRKESEAARGDLRSRRQGAAVAGLGINVAAGVGGGAGVGAAGGGGAEGAQGGAAAAAERAPAGRRRSRSVSAITGEVQELLSTSRSPEMAGAFSPLAPTPFSTPSLPSSPSSPVARSSSLARSASAGLRSAAASPAPSYSSSSTGTATTTARTPSLITSPYSDFGGAGSDTGSSAGDHGSGSGSGVLATPEVLHGWERHSALTVVEDSGAAGETTEYLDYRFGGASDGRDGPTPTVEKFPMPQTGLRFPPPPFENAHEQEGQVAPTPASSPAVGTGGPGAAAEDGAPPPTPTKDFAPSLLGNRSSPAGALSFAQQQQQQQQQPAVAPPLRSQFSLETLSSAPSSNANATAALPPPSSLPFSRPTSFAPFAGSTGLDPNGLPTPLSFGRSAFSFSPNSSVVSSLPPSILSASGFADREREGDPVRERVGKSSASTIASASSASTTPGGGVTPSGSIPGTPSGYGGEDQDPTLAFIFDSYAYSHSGSNSVAGSESGWSTPAAGAGGAGGSPVRSLTRGREGGGARAEEGYFPYHPSQAAAEEAQYEEEEEAEYDDDLAALPPTTSSSLPASPARPFGAASQLRSQIRFGGPGSDAPPTPTRTAPSSAAIPATRHARLLSTDSSLAALNIPRMSSIFPRSATDDSLASFAPSLRSSESEGGDESFGLGGGGAGGRYAFGMTARRVAPPPLHGGDAEREGEGQGTPQAGGGVRRNNTVPAPPSPNLSPTPPRRARSTSATTTSTGGAVPVASQAHLAADLAASRRLFQAHFPPPGRELAAAAAAAAQFSAPESPTRPEGHSTAALKRKSAKGLQISAPVVPGLGIGYAPAPQSAPLWRSQHAESPVRQTMPARGGAGGGRRGSEQEQEGGLDEEGDVFVALPSSMYRPPLPPPQLEIVGASPAAPQRYAASHSHQHQHARPSLDASFQYPARHVPAPEPSAPSPSLSVPAAASSTSAASTPSSTSHQTFASAQSSPMTDRSSSSDAAAGFGPSSAGYYYPTPPTSAATFNGAFNANSAAGPNKLRKAGASAGAGLQRMKSSPSLASFASAGSNGDPFVESGGAGSPRLAHKPSVGGLFGRSKAAAAAKEKERERDREREKERTSPTTERKVDYSAGISNKDFEEETVQIGKNAFEMVKPLAVALLGTPEMGGEGELDGPRGGGEEEERSSASLDGGRPPRKSSLSDHGRPSHDAGGGGDDLVTPRRPPPPSHLPTTTSAYSAQTSFTAFSAPSPILPSTGAPGGPSDFSRSALSLSHFSPATPSSVEDGGSSSVADHRAREQKWLQVLSAAAPGKEAAAAQQAKKKKALRALVHSGVPSSVRGKVWAFLAEAEVRPGVYQTLCNLDHLAPSPAIQHDLDTMLLDHPQFAPGTAGRDDLESVLRAFGRFDQQLCYYPGLVNVVALLLTQMPAESAFWTLCSLVRNYGFKQFFPSSKEELRLEMLAFGFLLEATESKLAKRLRDLSITPSDFLPIWLSTLFLSILPLPTTLRLIDLLLFDPKTRYRAPLALLDLSHLEDTLAFPTRDSVLNHLLAPPPEAFTPALLIPAVATMKLSDDKLKKAYKKAAQAMLKPQPIVMR
ncbi:hypothetical protein JCM6882_000095 [Rhodosporidiobolus microsporus]